MNDSDKFRQEVWMPLAVIFVGVAIFIGGVIAISHWLPPITRSITVHVIIDPPVKP